MLDCMWGLLDGSTTRAWRGCGKSWRTARPTRFHPPRSGRPVRRRLHAHLRPGPLLRGTPERNGTGPRSPSLFQVSESVAGLYRQALRRYGPTDGELLGIALLEEQARLRLRHPPTADEPDDSGPLACGRSPARVAKQPERLGVAAGKHHASIGLMAQHSRLAAPDGNDRDARSALVHSAGTKFVGYRCGRTVPGNVAWTGSTWERP